MIVFVPAGLFLLALVVGMLRDRRRLRNGFYLVFALFFTLVGVMLKAGQKHPALAAGIAGGLLLLALLSALVLAWFLVRNGLTMVRKEGRSPANLLSLLAGLGMIGLGAMLVASLATGSRALSTVTVVAVLVVGYVSFLFTCFLLYSLLYGWFRPRGRIDFVVVLGSGLIRNKVPPLLAGRLDKGRRVYESQLAAGGSPMLVTSGGQGPDEDRPEGQAMAEYLIEAGVPEDRIIQETRSRTTEENLAFSGALMRDVDPGYRCVVVTNNYHAFRAALMARKTGINGQVVGSRTARYFWPSAIIREFVAVFMQHKVVNFGMCALLAAMGSLAGLVV
ncbi:membrane protein [Streptomyces spiroverticillatus]|nr:YdcF family protein [Streptomyces finlayi]GHA29038.1 membrane protein [Streptomyces spiroverticillatus]